MSTEVELATTNSSAAAVALIEFLIKTCSGMDTDDFRTHVSGDGNIVVFAMINRYYQFYNAEAESYMMGIAQGWCAALEWADN